MKRSEIKRLALFDTVIANLEVELKEYRELDGNGLYIRVKPDSKWSWLGIGAYRIPNEQVHVKRLKR